MFSIDMFHKVSVFKMLFLMSQWGHILFYSVLVTCGTCTSHRNNSKLCIHSKKNA